MDPSIRGLLDDADVREFCERNHIRKLSLYGSALGDGFTEESDVDLLVEFHPDHIPGLFGSRGWRKIYPVSSEAGGWTCGPPGT